MPTKRERTKRLRDITGLEHKVAWQVLEVFEEEEKNAARNWMESRAKIQTISGGVIGSRYGSVRWVACWDTDTSRPFLINVLHESTEENRRYINQIPRNINSIAKRLGMDQETFSKMMVHAREVHRLLMIYARSENRKYGTWFDEVNKLKSYLDYSHHYTHSSSDGWIEINNIRLEFDDNASDVNEIPF